MKRIVVIAAALMMAVSASASEEISTAAVCAAAPAKTETVTFNVSMSCKNCVKKITENISFEKGVKDLKVDLATKTVTITYDPAKTTAEKLQAAISKLGYKVSRA